MMIHGLSHLFGHTLAQWGYAGSRNDNPRYLKASP